LRVRHGKGAKERVLPLSARLIRELESYWRAQRLGRAGQDIPWLFLGTKPREPMSRTTGQNIYYRGLRRFEWVAVAEKRAPVRGGRQGGTARNEP